MTSTCVAVTPVFVYVCMCRVRASAAGPAECRASGRESAGRDEISERKDSGDDWRTEDIQGSGCPESLWRAEDEGSWFVLT